MDPRLQQISPLVVIGMHRSGTRLLAEILGKLGIFMGADQQADSESVTFMLINEGILHQCGAFWSEPMAAHFLLSQPDFVDQLAASVRTTLASQLAGFVGQSGWQLAPTPAQTPPFGWKDPRNTFTLPVWRQVFPNLRVIHIVRHGVDVAASLARRHSAALQAATGESFPAALTVIEDHVFGVLSSRRGWTLAEALTMWEQYVEKARLEMADLGNRSMEIRFEDVLSDPNRAITAIAKFCGTAITAQHTQWFASLKSSRAYAFRRDPKLVSFAATVSETLQRYDYTP